jgi:hypothetical protein
MLIALTAAAFVAGMTGSWSPCGLSMISTLGPRDRASIDRAEGSRSMSRERRFHSGGRLTTIAACIAFVPGAVLGGVLTFGSLAVAGSVIGGGPVALAAGALVVLGAAALELRGTPIVPQVRRQVPEHWRRVMPLPLAAAGYGVLLGLGFTTFVLTFAVPALAGASLAVGDPVTGVAIGLAFGVGRALPVVVLAPFSRTEFGLRVSELMMERPSVLRSFRFADGIALLAVALVLAAQSAELASITLLP